MKFVQVEHFDDMEEVITFWVDISDVSLANQKRARKIDGQEYRPECFGVCAGYHIERKEYYLVYDTEAGGRDYVYYIDINGDKHWLPAKITKAFREQVFKGCQEAINGERST